MWTTIAFSVWCLRVVTSTIQVFYIKDCVIEKTGLPAKNVSAKVLGAYKECESSDALSRGKINQGVNFSPVISNNINQPRLQQAPIQQYQYSTVQYMGPNQVEQQLSLPPTQPVQQPVRINQQTIQQQPSSEYDFAAEITRQCLVPDPVGLLDCVENKVDLPYLSSWVVCTNSLGQNVATSEDIINYRCKSVWEGKGVIPEVFFIKDCVIERIGLPAKEVSAKILGAYKECEKNSPPKQQNLQTKTSFGVLPPSSPQFGQRVTLQNPQQQQNAEYDFAAEISRQCRVPDPVGLLNCVENKVDLPYLSSWVSCTNSLGQNVATSADVINYRCKSVWEGKGVIPEVFWIKDCVIEKTGLPARTVSAKVLGAYKECEGNSPSKPQNSQIKTGTLPSLPQFGQPAALRKPQQQQQNAEYDFAAEISRQCRVPDPVGLLDCVENKVDLPYLSSWVSCTNSLGQNVATSADVINYRCKSVWEGKGVIQEVFWIKDCVIEKTGLPARTVSAKVLGAYKECEGNSPSKPQNSQIKTGTLPSFPQFGQPTALQKPQQQQQNAEYDFAAEISRQCRVPDPVGLLNCVENKVDLPYLSSWISCTNSLGQRVATSADVINYRCKSVWEGKGVIPEVFWIKDCVIEKTNLPARTVSAKVLGAYKECENSPKSATQSGQTKHQGGPVLQKPSVPQRQPMTRQYFMLQPSLPINVPPAISLQKPINSQVLQQPIQQQKILQQPIQQQQILQQPFQQQQKKVQPIQRTQIPAPFQPNNAYYYNYIAPHPIRKLN